MEAAEIKPESTDRPYEKGLVLLVAQQLYDHYTSMGLNPKEWIECLQMHLAESVSEDIREKINRIITVDKGIKLEELDDSRRDAIIREVAEWLAAEKIVDKMHEYERHIEKGLAEGHYRKIDAIEEVVAVKDKDLMMFGAGNPDEIKRQIKEQYVIAMRTPVGQGRRVKIFELVPRYFPFPVPKTDEVNEGLMLKYPNRGLVVRLPQENYLRMKGPNFNADEQRAISTLALADESFSFGKDYNADAIPAELRESLQNSRYLREKLAHSENGRTVFSFIPPLAIVIMRINGDNEVTYATVQKRIMAEGPLFSYGGDFFDDLEKIPGFDKKIAKFIAANKRFYLKEGRLPDLAGSDNVLYTAKGNIYLVDVNNIVREPDYKTLALMILLNKLLEKNDYAKNADEKNTLEVDISTVKAELEKQCGNLPDAEDVARRIFYFDEDLRARDFLVEAGFFDDMNYPVFPASVCKLHELELRILEHKLQTGKTGPYEFERAGKSLEDEPLYRILYPKKNYKRGRAGIDIEEVMRSVREGDESYVTFFSNNFLNFFIRWIDRGGNLDD